MSVARAAFSERIFEFAFNAEFVKSRSALLAGTPDIPSQQEEKWLGYDVEFQINLGHGVIGSIALQHKVARIVTGQASSNRHFRAVAGRPYFAFGVDVDQFNLIESIASLQIPGVRFYYCAPYFFSRRHLDKYYSGSTVTSRSRWFDVAGVGSLNPSVPHSLVYKRDATKAWVFSEQAKPIRVHKPTLPTRTDENGKTWSVAVVEIIHNRISHAIRTYWPQIQLRKKEQKQGTEDNEAVPFSFPQDPPKEMGFEDLRSGIIATSHLFADYLGMSWILTLRQRPQL